jgi:hypothetical protein
MFFEEKEFHQNDNQCKKEHENRNAVDTMHVSHPTAMRCIRISLFDIKIFCYLTENSHKFKILYKDNTMPYYICQPGKFSGLVSKNIPFDS